MLKHSITAAIDALAALLTSLRYVAAANASTAQADDGTDAGGDQPCGVIAWLLHGSESVSSSAEPWPRALRCASLR
jgi:hypothetical protein